MQDKERLSELIKNRQNEKIETGNISTLYFLRLISSDRNLEYNGLFKPCRMRWDRDRCQICDYRKKTTVV
jgi:hypothetical protein